MHSFRYLFIVMLTCLFLGCHYIGAPPSKRPFGEETGGDGPFNKVANAFLLDLKAGQIKEAYARTSKDYQKEVNEDQFKAILKKNPFPSGGGTSSKGHVSVNDVKTRKYSLTENLSSGSIDFTLEVTKVGDEYQVSKFSLK